MVIRKYMKCDVCGDITLVRIQVGLLDYHPIRYHCGNCEILITGDKVQDDENVRVGFSFQNCKEVEECRPHHYFEVSSELLTDKVRNYDSLTEEEEFISPYLKTVGYLGDKNYMKFSKDVSNFILVNKTQWPTIRRIFELYLNDKSEYLKKEVRQFLSPTQFPTNSPLECTRSAHFLMLRYCNSMMKDTFFTKTTNFIFTELQNILEHNPRGYSDMLKHFEANGFLLKYERKFFDLVCNFSTVYRSILPAVSFYFFNKSELEEVKQVKGISTASFEDVKQFYIDAYEFIAECMYLVTCHNNVRLRSSFEDYKGKINNTKEYMRMSKGSRNQYCTGEEPFDNLVSGFLNTKLRNAIGHNSYSYNGLSQMITYDKSSTETQSIYLLDFSIMCFEMFMAAIRVEELVYQTRKGYFATIGYSTVDPSVFGRTHKIGRNEQCPCGSGQKYKRCCGVGH